MEFGYERPKDDKREDLPFKKLSKEDKSEFAAEQRMIALIQSAIRMIFLHCLTMMEIKNENKGENVVNEVKEKTREEILSAKTYRERNIALNRMDEMQEEYESAVSNKRWDKKRECYFNREVEYYINVLKDDTYAKRHEKEIRYAMTSCLRKRDEERMKKNVRNGENLKKVAEEVKGEAVEVEVVKEIKVVKEEDLKVVETEKTEEKVEVNEEVEKVVTEKQQVVEDEKKSESLTEVKIENLKSASDEGAGDAGDEKKEELK
ncbi:uncharacterized protein LOC110933191 [Helianthus annuus]|uniref:uncharacterized protein LOC110933191 n=1 Tax=Helianthus annuus TaxID=4232 RepID=UPI000B8FDFA8|nr:uncharacterized protein LOC110933191 [Helianthus annuus]